MDSQPAPLVKDACLTEVSHTAMSTTFRVVCGGVTSSVAREAARSCFARIDTLEGLLSRYRHGSDVQMINTSPVDQAVKVGPDCWECLVGAFDVWRLTGGACDVTVGRLVDWYKTAGAATAPEELVGMVGFRHLHLLPEYKAVVRATEEVRVDLGALGKGYALDRAAEHLRVDWEIGTFLVECGTSSSVFSVSAGSTWQWPVVMDLTRGKRLRLGLRDGSVSGSAAELKQRHIVNPITGEYLMPMQRAWAYAPTGLLSDALSTAFTILSMEEIAAVCAARTDVGAVVARAENVEWFGTIPGSESNS